MRLLYASTLYPPAIGGSQIHLHRLAQTMQERGHRVQVVTYTSRYRRDWLRLSTVLAEREHRYDHEGIAVGRLGFSLRTRLRMLPWAAAYYGLMGSAVRHLAGEIAPYLQRLGGPFDLLHVTRNGREFLAQAGLELARRRGVPYVLTPNHHPRWDGALYREYSRIYREADAVIALTAAERKTLVTVHRVSEDRTHVTGIGPILSERHSAEAFRVRYGLRDPFVLFLGQQLEYKGVGAVLTAAPLVWRRHPDVRFVFAGPRTGWSERVFARVGDERIVNLGEIDLETKTSALAASELLCVPSAQESFGGVYVEAWSLRKPVVAGNIPTIASLVEEGRDGLLSSQNPASVADAVMQLLDDPRQRRAMGAAGWEKVQRRYTWEQLAARTASIYESFGAGTPAAAHSRGA